MTPSLKRKLTIGVLGTALLGIAGGGAYAATAGSSNPRQAFLDDVAGRLHVTSAQLDAALKGASADQLAAAVKAGKLTQAEADRIKQKIQSGAGIPPLGVRGGMDRGGPFPGGPLGGARPFLRGPFLGALDGVAKYLGLTDAQLRTKVASGKSLAQIAQAQKKSVAGLETAIKDAAKKGLDAEVAAKHITQQQETKILGALDTRVGDLVQGKLPGPRKFFRPGARGGHGFGFRSAPGG
jgi:hypothetical protein